MPKFKLTNLKFEQIMKDYATVLEKSLPETVHTNARLLCVELARRTQAFGHESEEQQNERIRKDISNIIKPPVYFLKFLSQTTSEKLKANLKKNYFSGQWTKIASTLAAVGMGSEAFTPVASGAMRIVHQLNRNKNTGRTFKRPQKFYIASDSTSLHDYISERQKAAGISKSGWAECAEGLKKVVKGSMSRGIKPWVTRHSKGLGTVTDKTSNRVLLGTSSKPIFQIQNKNPSVVLTNSIPWADKVIRETEQLMAMNIVAIKMKKQMETILKKRKEAVQ
jgi:hypothetical protein